MRVQFNGLVSILGLQLKPDEPMQPPDYRQNRICRSKLARSPYSDATYALIYEGGSEAFVCFGEDEHEEFLKRYRIILKDPDPQRRSARYKALLIEFLNKSDLVEIRALPNGKHEVVPHNQDYWESAAMRLMFEELED